MAARPQWLIEMERTAKYATPGSWQFERISWEHGGFSYEFNDVGRLIAIAEMNYDSPMKAKFDATHIAAASPDRVLALLALVEELAAALEYTQRTDVIIGHSDAEDGKLRGMPDKIMMRNKCAAALAKYQAGPGSEGGTK